jgi:glucose/arabinose dehydrogenase/mono/diheme cytochrome c family protein
MALQAEERIPWTSSNISGSPESPMPYQAEAVWPHITFNQPLDITLLESEKLLFVSERFGKIWRIPADTTGEAEEKTLVADMNVMFPNLDRLLGLEFHPDFSANRRVFVYYVTSKLGPGFDCVLGEFRMDEGWTLTSIADGTLLRFHGEGHTGGDIQFGPDGLLYVPIGDLTPPSPPDANLAGQDLGQLGGKILRIDVDGKDPGLPYRIPKDNPFVDLEGVRSEVWAYGFRNPWKLCFHPETGELWLGDVGWELWEMVHRVVEGGNYGWSIMEGPMPTNTDQDSGPSPITSPVVAYDHYQGASVTGGYFVTGNRLPKLKGSYVYADYVTGKVWALNWDGSTAANREIADTQQPIVTFGLDLSGELLFAPLTRDASLQRLVDNPKASEPTPFPRYLSETGLFTDTAGQSPAPGVYEYKIKAPMWQDGAETRYWIGLPEKTKLTASLEDRRGSPHVRYYEPKDMALAKSIRKNGRIVETQVLHFDGYWRGYSYQWNDDQSDATLVDKDGLSTVIDGSPYRFLSRAECFRCHGSNFNRPLAFLPGQVDFDGQIDRFHSLGMVDDVFVHAAKSQPLANPYDEAGSLELRARSWLHSNCSHCHKVSGGSGLTAQMNAAVSTEGLELIGHDPKRGYFGLDDAPQIDPGNPYRSILYYRIATKGAGHMPMIGLPTVDHEGVRVVHDWIRSMMPETPVPDVTLEPKNVEEALVLYHKIQAGELSDADRKRAIKACLGHEEPFVVNLFVGMGTE